jgi:hypothetical protein
MGVAEHLQHQFRFALHHLSGIQQTGVGSNGTDRPDQIAKPHLSTARKQRAGLLWRGPSNGVGLLLHPIHVAGGTGPNQGRFGTVGRDTFRGPAFYNFDFALIKDTPFGRRQSGAERMDLQFRTEFFNLFNIVTMGLPANILSGSGFGGNQQDRRQLAPDSVLAQAHLLTVNSRKLAMPWYKGCDKPGHLRSN